MASKKTKRGNGEGSISQRKDGRWVARLSLADGKRKAYYGRTRDEVKRKLTKGLNDQQDGLPIVGERQTVAQFLEHWLDATAQHTLRPRTFVRYQQLVRVHALPRIGKKTLARLTPQDLSALYSTRLESGSSPRTVQFLHAVLHRALKQALRWDLIPRNPADAVTPPSPKRPEIRPLDPEQANALLDTAVGDPLEALYVLAIMTGMRQGELLGLRWQAIDWESGRVTVAYTLQRLKGEWGLSETKTRGSRRSIRLAPTALAALRAHRARQNEQRLAVGADWEDNGLVFPRDDGRPLDTRAITRSLRPLLAKAGLPRIRFHDLRHTVGTSAIARGIPLVVVKEMLGHSTISITADIYSHVLPPHQDELAEHMERLYGRTATK